MSKSVRPARSNQSWRDAADQMVNLVPNSNCNRLVSIGAVFQRFPSAFSRRNFWFPWFRGIVFASGVVDCSNDCEWAVTFSHYPAPDTRRVPFFCPLLWNRGSSLVIGSLMTAPLRNCWWLLGAPVIAPSYLNVTWKKVRTSKVGIFFWQHSIS